MHTKGFCSALLRCGEIKLIAEKREYQYAISDLIANIARTNCGAEQNPSVRNLVSPHRMCPASFSFSGLNGVVGVLRPARFSENFSSTDTLKSS